MKAAAPERTAAAATPMKAAAPERTAAAATPMKAVAAATPMKATAPERAAAPMKADAKERAAAAATPMKAVAPEKAAKAPTGHEKRDLPSPSLDYTVSDTTTEPIFSQSRSSLHFLSTTDEDSGLESDSRVDVLLPVKQRVKKIICDTTIAAEKMRTAMQTRELKPESEAKTVMKKDKKVAKTVEAPEQSAVKTLRALMMKSKASTKAQNLKKSRWIPKTPDTKTRRRFVKNPKKSALRRKSSPLKLPEIESKIDPLKGCHWVPGEPGLRTQYSAVPKPLVSSQMNTTALARPVQALEGRMGVATPCMRSGHTQYGRLEFGWTTRRPAVSIKEMVDRLHSFQQDLIKRRGDGDAKARPQVPSAEDGFYVTRKLPVPGTVPPQWSPTRPVPAIPMRSFLVSSPGDAPGFHQFDLKFAGSEASDASVDTTVFVSTKQFIEDDVPGVFDQKQMSVSSRTRFQQPSEEDMKMMSESYTDFQRTESRARLPPIKTSSKAKSNQAKKTKFMAQ